MSTKTETYEFAKDTPSQEIHDRLANAYGPRHDPRPLGSPDAPWDNGC